MLSNIDYFYIGYLTQLKKNKRENGPSQQVLRHVIDTTVNLISLFNPNSRRTKLLITLLAQEYGFKSRNISFFPPRKCLRYTYI